MCLPQVACAQLAAFCRHVLKQLSSEDNMSSDGVEDHQSQVPVASQHLLQAQRQFHGYLMDYEPLFAKVRELEGSGGRRTAELQRAYADGLSGGFLKARISHFFAEILPRVLFSSGSLGLAHLEPVPTGHVCDPIDPPSETADDVLITSQLTVVAAVQECLEYTMPAIVREQAFFSTLFGLNTATDDRTRGIVHKTLAIGFEELKIRFNKLAIQLGEHVSDVLGVLALVEEAQSNPQYQNDVAARILLDFKGLLVERFRKFVGEQVSWIQGQRGDAKRAGVLVPVSKFPALVAKMESAIRAATRGSQIKVEEAEVAYQKWAGLLFKHIEDVAHGNPKYADIVRLENYHFFSSSLKLLKVVPSIGDHITQAEAQEELATARYLEWLVGYQFPQLTHFFARVEDLISSVGVANVAYQEPRRNLEASVRKHCDLKSISEGLKSTHQRMVKHLSKEGHLLGPLWDKLSDTLFAMFSRYEELCSMCYHYTLDPSASDVKEAANQIGRRLTSGEPHNSPDGHDYPSPMGTPLSGGGSFSQAASSPSLDIGGDSSGRQQRGLTLTHGAAAGSFSSSHSGASLSSPGRSSSPVNRGKAFISRHLRLGS
ncbi:unnamed protein product [Discosporangium mesarthrocarpum]